MGAGRLVVALSLGCQPDVGNGERDTLGQPKLAKGGQALLTQSTGQRHVAITIVRYGEVRLSPGETGPVSDVTLEDKTFCGEGDGCFGLTATTGQVTGPIQGLRPHCGRGNAGLGKERGQPFLPFAQVAAFPPEPLQRTGQSQCAGDLVAVAEKAEGLADVVDLRFQPVQPDPLLGAA